MKTLLDCFTDAVLLFLPFIPVLYVFMLTVADSIIAALQNWND